MTLSIVVIGLSVTSSWGNGHATTYRALIEALAQRDHRVTFLERDMPWYREHRDLATPSTWSVALYQSLPDLALKFGTLVSTADVVIVGSYVPDGIAVAEWVTTNARGITAFYDIDTPVTLAGLDRGLPYLSAALIPRFDLYLSFAGGPVPKVVETEFGSPLARVLHCSADMDLYQGQQGEPKWELGYLGTYSRDRQPSVERFLVAPACAMPDLQFVVAGSQYPDMTWPENVARIDHLAPSQHAGFYSEQRFTLNVTRADMRALGFSPSVRLFEAAACGTPIISDRWTGIETILEPEAEIFLVDDSSDVIELLRNMPDERRRSIGAKARRRILAEHTPAHRARQLESYVQEAMSQRRPKSAGRPAVRTKQAAEF
ncbi:CgeB family protein [Bradyrhizobium pachyrhizi]|uniref:CgeB family protein n=1 Tax=Bradyrhizobium pachyrhizi TaxID=280333 RepID=UPI00067AF557|nr:glycosyltransferase [Bradyrhizobium pachyrhizi]